VSAFTFISSSVLVKALYCPTRQPACIPIFVSVAITRLGSPKSFHSTPVAGRTDNSYEQPARIASGEAVRRDACIKLVNNTIALER